MSDEDFSEHMSNSTMNIFLYKAKSQFELFSEARERYHEIVEKLKDRIKDIPLENLIELSENNSKAVKTTDPDNVPDHKLPLSESAKREIHRRAFQEFTIAPTRKEKLNTYGIGFLRKPTF